MSTFKTPVGPQPGRVYWRRRLLALLVAVVVIVIVVLIIVRLGAGGSPTAGKTPDPNPSPSASKALVIKDCKKSDITVEAQTDAGTYAAGVKPMLSMVVTNTGTVPCNMMVGTDVQVYTITSGTEKIWSSKDCQTGPVAATKLLDPGVPADFPKFAWDRTRSDTSTCKDKNKPQVIAKGASYHLGVTINGFASAKTKQFVLN
jgi:hypothetical protein